MNEIFQALVLGVIQGLTEFLPISSSAHLYLVPYLLNWDYRGLGFDVALHWGTLAAVLVIFWRDYLDYLLSFFKSFGSQRDSSDLKQRMAWLLILGSIPAAVLGFLFESEAETVFRSPVISIITLSIFALLLLWADQRGKVQQQGMEDLSWRKVLFIGSAQAIALIPGVSRSGVTMTAGLFSGLSRVSAARFSFLLLGPIAFGAGLVTIPSINHIDTALVVGFFTAAISGYAAVRFLLFFVSNRSYAIFVWYRLILAALISIALLVR